MKMLLATLLVAAAALGAAAQSPAAGAPGTTLSGPSGQTADATPTYTFASDEPGTTFACQVDGGDWVACASPWTVQLADGEHQLAVRATDEAGNVDPTPATRTVVVDTSGVDTAIDAGPSGLTNDPTPSFTFSTPVSGATFACRITGAASPLPAFTRCSSPLELPQLVSGAYALEVRAISPAGRPDPTPARRAFTVDADAPDTELTEAPAEGADSPSRTPRFGFRSEPGARFECRMDPRTKNDVELVAWAPCDAAGFTPARALSGGLHTFEVRALDAAGNADPSPARRTFRVVACEQIVRFALTEVRGACLQAEGTDEQPSWTSTGPITVNGLPVPAVPGSTAVITGPVAGADGDGGVLQVKNVKLEAAGLTLYKGDLRWKLPAGGEGDEKEVTSLDVGGQKLFGMKVSGKIGVRFGRRRGTELRYGVLTVHVDLPSVLKAGPSGGSPTLTGDVGIRMDPVAGVQLDGLKVAVGNAYLGGLGVKSLCLSYLKAGATFTAGCTAPSLGGGKPQPFITCRTDVNVDRWDGALAIVLPTASKTELGLWGGLSDGRFSHAGAYADRLGTAVPLAPGVFLDRVALGVCVDPPPFKVKGEVGVGFGPDFNGHKAALLNGWMEYTDASGDQPWIISAGGSLALFDKPMADAWLTYRASGMLDFGFHAGFNFDDKVKLDGNVAGWVETTGSRRFNVEGDITVCADIIGCIGGNALVSSVGVAGCATLHTRFADLTGGVGYPWKGKVKIMAGSCDVGPWRAQRASVARAAGAAPTFTVAPGQRGAVVRVRGTDAVPKVVLVGPDGRRISTDVAPGKGFVQGSHLMLADPEEHSIAVLIADPAPGAWRIETVPGSSALAGVDRADVLPAVALKARVTGRGRDRRLVYAVRPHAGQAVTFVERGRRTARTLGTARGGRCADAARRRAGWRCGVIRFRPAAGGAGRREIKALVTQDGAPRSNPVVARYTAPADALPSKPVLAVRRLAGAIRVSWRPVADATQVNVVVRTADGRRVLFTRPAARAGSVRLPGVKAATGATVTVRGMRLDRREGRAATARLAAKRPAQPKKKTRRTR